MNLLINKDDFIEATQLKKYKIEIAAGSLMKLTGIKRLNKIYSESSAKKGREFIDYMLTELAINFRYNPDDLKKIPESGPFISVSNHPFGFLDSLLLIKAISYVRDDYKLFTNEILKNFVPIHHYLLLETEDEIDYHAQQTKAYQLLSEGFGIGIFPTIRYSRNKPNAEELWDIDRIQFIKNAEAPVIPICFVANISLVKFLSGLIKPNFKNQDFSAELLKNKPKEIMMRIGSEISQREKNEFSSTSKFARYMRAKTYLLGSSINISSFFSQNVENYPKNPKPIAEAIDEELIIEEISKLPAECKINTKQNFDLYVAGATQLPNVLQEIGRLRELTFRAVGEGTNNPSDLDEFDLYYYHLFLWDREEKKIVGAYRVGKGGEIMDKLGKKGFYTNSLFRSSGEFDKYLRQSIELGRSFIIPEYQNKRLPLFMLWQGILYFLIQNPDYRYILGPVSISNNYSNLSKSLIVAFIKKYYFDHELAKFIHPRKKYHVDTKNLDTESLLPDSKDNLKKIDRLILDIEPYNRAMPVLLKKYIKQNAKIISFNIDPKFSDALDGLMILDVKNVPQETLDNLKRDFSIDSNS